MSEVKSMKYTTCEDVLRLRDKALELESALQQAEARVAVQSDALFSIAVAMKDACSLTKDMHDFILSATDGDAEAFILRKQAEAVEYQAREWNPEEQTYSGRKPHKELIAEAQSLYQQANELEADKAGGEQCR